MKIKQYLSNLINNYIMSLELKAYDNHKKHVNRNMEDFDIAYDEI